MQAARRTPRSLAPILPSALRTWAAPIESALRGLLIPDRVMHAFESARHCGGAAEFARGLLDSLDIHYVVPEADLQRVPTNGVQQRLSSGI